MELLSRCRFLDAPGTPRPTIRNIDMSEPRSPLTRLGSVTLPQVLMLRRLIEHEADTPSALARSLNMAASAVSQMLDRLFQLQLVRRTEDPDDRRRRRVTATSKARWLVKRLGRARSTEYRVGISRLSPGLQRELAALLSRAVTEVRSLAEAGAERGTPDPGSRRSLAGSGAARWGRGPS